jgi:hypothetical protein
MRSGGVALRVRDSATSSATDEMSDVVARAIVSIRSGSAPTSLVRAWSWRPTSRRKSCWRAAREKSLSRWRKRTNCSALAPPSRW